MVGLIQNDEELVEEDLEEAPQDMEGVNQLITQELKTQLIHKLAEVAIDEVECVGFDVAHLTTPQKVDSHRTKALQEREEMDSNNNKKNKEMMLSMTSIDLVYDEMLNEDTNNDNDGGGGRRDKKKNKGGATATFHVGGMSCAV